MPASTALRVILVRDAFAPADEEVREAGRKNCEEKLSHILSGFPALTRIKDDEKRQEEKLNVTGIEEKCVQKGITPQHQNPGGAAERKNNLYDEIICSSFDPLFPFDLRRLLSNAYPPGLFIPKILFCTTFPYLTIYGSNVQSIHGRGLLPSFPSSPIKISLTSLQHCSRRCLVFCLSLGFVVGSYGGSGGNHSSCFRAGLGRRRGWLANG